MEKLDDATAAIFRAANVTDLDALTRDDLRDLFPGPENFTRRKTIWHTIHSEDQELRDCGGASSEPSLPWTSTPVRSTPPVSKTPDKTVKIHSPEYVLYTDTELEHVRKQYSDLERVGKQNECEMSKDLRCRVIRNTMTSMISILRATGDGESHRYPAKPEMTAMAKRLVQYYPMLKDQDMGEKNTWVTVYTQLYKRLQNVRSPVRGKCPARGKFPVRGKSSVKKLCMESSLTEDEFGSSDTTVNLDSSSEGTQDSDMGNRDNSLGDSLTTQAKHYRSLQNLWKKSSNPNKESVSQLLDLELEARRAFIDSDTVKEEDRPEKILEAYPCFREIEHVMDELRRILDKDNLQFVTEVKTRWAEFCQKVQFFGVFKKVLKSPVGTGKDEQAVELMRALPAIFPSPSAPPKKMRDVTEALFVVLQEREDPSSVLKKRPLSCPVLIISPTNCVLAVGGCPVSTFRKDLLSEGLLYVMAYYYALHLTYPKCIATVLSVIQSEVLFDSLHQQDQTSSYKKAINDWRAFVGK